MSDVRRFCSRYAAGTESMRGLVDTRGRTQPDADEGPFYVLASDYDALAAQLAAAQARVAEMEAREKETERLLAAFP